MTDDRKKISARHTIPDNYLTEARDPFAAQMIVKEAVAGTLDVLSDAAAAEKREVDWTTLDLRVFRDVSLEAQKRDPWLLVRADALTKGATP